MLFGISIMGMFFPNPIFYNIWLYGGLALFTAFVAFDTQNAVTAYEEGDRDPVNHSVQFFINFISLFRRILMLLMGGGRD